MPDIASELLDDGTQEIAFGGLITGIDLAPALGLFSLMPGCQLLAHLPPPGFLRSGILQLPSGSPPHLLSYPDLRTEPRVILDAIRAAWSG